MFRATGVAHLLSISGLHVTMFAWLAAAAVGALWRSSGRLCLAWPAQHAAVVGGLLLATGYALFSGWGVPAQRTLLMLAAVAWLRLSGRRWPWPVTWLFACAVVVTADPWALMQAGFWLSFVAVGVLFAADPGGRRPAGLVQRGVALVREQAVVTLALAPLSLLLFGQVSLVGLLANLVAIPWVTLVVTPLALLGTLLPPSWDLAAWAVQAMGFALQALASWPFAVWTGATPPLWAGAAGVLGGLLLALRLPAPVRAVGLPLLLAAVRWRRPPPPPAPRCSARPCGGTPRGRPAVSSSCWPPTSARATPCWCAPPAARWSTTPARASAARPTPASACWCRCCGRWASAWTAC